MIITLQNLKDLGVCSEAVDEWESRNIKSMELVKLLRLCEKEGYWGWANWLLVRIMTREQRLSYAIYAAEQVIKIYEKQYPEDTRPRAAIQAAKRVLKNDTNKNRSAAGAAANAAYTAYCDADAADNAAYTAYAAADAAYVDYAAGIVKAVETAAYAAGAAGATDAERDKLQHKILEYGIKLLEK